MSSDAKAQMPSKQLPFLWMRIKKKDVKIKNL